MNSQNTEIGYNIQEGGEGGATRSHPIILNEKQKSALDYGRHLPSSDLHKKQLSQRRKNCVVSEETRNKIKEKRKLQVFSEETKQKMSNSRLGKKMPPRKDSSIELYRQGSLDRVHIHKGNVNKNPKKDDLQKYLDDGWVLGYYYKH